MAKSNGTKQTDQAISKMEAMRRTLAKLGQDAKPLEIQSHVKSEFGIDMNTNVISAYKSTLKAVKKSAVKRVKAATAHEANGAKATKAATPGAEGRVSVDDIIAIKELADRIGTDHMKKLVDVLGK